MRARSLSSSCNSDSVSPSVDFRSFASLLRNCRSFRELKELHDQISSSGYDRNTYLGNHLVRMYGKCGSVEEAKNAFDRIKQKNIFSWNIMLTAFAATKDQQRSSELFRKYPRWDLFSWNSMIAALVQAGELISANELLKEMGEFQDAVSWNTIITAYAESGQIQRAQELFDEMPCRSNVSWNSMISGYSQNGEIFKAKFIFDRLPEFNLLSYNLALAGLAQNGLGKEAIHLLAMLDSEGIDPDGFTITSAIDACGAIGDLRMGREFHEELLSTPGESYSVVSATALITMYGRCGEPEESKRVFDEMNNRNVVSWNAIVTALGENGRIDQAAEAFEFIPLKDLASWNIMLSVYARNGDSDSARLVFRSMPEQDVVSWNAMISAFADGEDLFRFDLEHSADAGRVLEAISLLKRMDLEGIQANKVSFIGALSACHGNGALQQGRLLHSLISELDLETDLAVGTVLVIMYGKCGSPEEAKQVFEGMIETRSAVTWNALVAAYARNGHTLQAISLLRALIFEGFQPHFMVFNSVLFACSHRGMLEEGLKQFRVMIGDFHIAANFSHFLCLIDLLGRAGELQLAEDLAQFMPFQSDQLVWTVLLSSSRSHNDVERGAMAALRLLEFDHRQASPYAALSSLYCC